jgi:hypothetical protein
MGDPRHQAGTSDHNLGDAIDITAALADGVDVDRLADLFRTQMKRAPLGRVKYMIRSRRIVSERDGWEWRPYTGQNPHTTHLHISIRADRRTLIRPWSF